MAMNRDTSTGPDTLASASPALDRAAEALRSYIEPRWVEIEASVLERVLRHHRASFPVQARSSSGTYRVSETVLIQSLQQALDPIPHCELEAVRIHLEEDTYRGVTLVIRAQYPHPLILLADQIRATAESCLLNILGPITPPVSIETMHVHIDDVTSSNPKLE